MSDFLHMTVAMQLKYMYPGAWDAAVYDLGFSQFHPNLTKCIQHKMGAVVPRIPARFPEEKQLAKHQGFPHPAMNQLKDKQSS
jgi:hypothetical protein